VPLVRRGKVRDIYDLGDSLLLVASDRLSAFDVVLPDPIPDKGRVLTQISLFWFETLAPLARHHLISGDVHRFPAVCQPYADVLAERSMRVCKTEPLPIECVVRGYLSGSGWQSYRESGTVCGIALPSGLRESDRLPEPIFTPSTKEEVGVHDQNIDFETAVQRVGRSTAEAVRDLSLALYRRGAALAEARGIIIADTKFEFGRSADGQLMLIDEVLTPDSSRFWPKASYRPGSSPPSFDKQFVRDYLNAIRWDKRPPAPSLPAEVIAGTSQRYREALTQLTGRTL
jgi:phosphoribosylaminoimidazole-succinocarboxamide synthase